MSLLTTFVRWIKGHKTDQSSPTNHCPRDPMDSCHTRGRLLEVRELERKVNEKRQQGA